MADHDVKTSKEIKQRDENQIGSEVNRNNSEFNRNDSVINRCGSELTLVDEDEEKEGNCGYGSCEPKFLQCFNNAKGFLFLYCLTVITQGMLVNGFINVSISTLEKRFGFTSSEAGVMAVGYDMSFCALTLFLTYFFARSHRPRIVGIGIFILGVGAMTFMLPHFTTPLYEYSDGFGETCSDGRSECTGANERSDLSYYLGVFIVAQLLHGIGCTPLYTLGLSYMEDSVPKESASLYLGIGNAASVLGPVIGYAFGGVVLSYYVDFDVLDPSEIPLTSNDPRWVGAWWLGILASMACAFVCCIPYFAFPKVIPGTHKYRAMRKSEVPANGGENVVGNEDFGKSFKDFPIALLTLLKNPTYVFASLGLCSDSLIIAGFTTFLPKLVENEFQVSAGAAALVAGVIGIPGGMVGHVVSGLLVRWFKMSSAKIFLVNVLYCLAVFAMAPILLLYCPNRPVAGVTSPYINSTDPTGNLTSFCNSGCLCQEEYFIPVCGADGINYFTACHAGCENSDVIENVTYFYNCTCINVVDEEGWQATDGYCPTNDCDTLILFLCLFFVVVWLTFMASTPSIVATFRIVPPNLRSFAIGTQWLLIRALGTIPGPILFGFIIDLTCILWQTRQCENTRGSCWIYDSKDMAVNAIAITMACKLLSSILFFAAYWSYKAPVESNSDESEMKKFSNPSFDASEEKRRSESSSIAPDSASDRPLNVSTSDDSITAL